MSGACTQSSRLYLGMVKSSKHLTILPIFGIASLCLTFYLQYPCGYQCLSIVCLWVRFLYTTLPDNLRSFSRNRLPYFSCPALPFLCLCVCLPAYLPALPLLCLSVCLSVCLPVRLPFPVSAVRVSACSTRCSLSILATAINTRMQHGIWILRKAIYFIAFILLL